LLHLELASDFGRCEPALAVPATLVLAQASSLQDVQAFEDGLLGLLAGLAALAVAAIIVAVVWI